MILLHISLNAISHFQISEFTIRLGAQSVTLLSTLRDPTQLRQRQCASRKQHPFFCSHVMFESKELKFLLLVRRQGIDQTQKSTASRQKKYS